MEEDKQKCQIKICGLTDPSQAAECAEKGVHAIGLVFYPKSRRCVSRDQALEISRALPEGMDKVGVFVNEAADYILKTAEKSRLTAVQLHGKEPPETVRELKRSGLKVIKALYFSSEPGISEAGTYGADACLIEYSEGPLPGGNAFAWNWSRAADAGRSFPFILAGGLSPENVASAIESADPDCVDVSSGVEKAPGVKDISRVAAFVDSANQCRIKHPIRRIFNADRKQV